MRRREWRAAQYCFHRWRASIDWRDASDEDVEASKDKLGVLDDLSARRDALDKRENELKTREALLKVTEQEIDRKYQELTQMRTEIKNLLDKQTEEEKAADFLSVAFFF